MKQHIFQNQRMTIEQVVKKYLMYSNYLEMPSSGTEEFQLFEKTAPEEFVILCKIFTPAQEIASKAT